MSLSSYFIVVLVESIVTWCILVIKRHASINRKTDKIL